MKQFKNIHKGKDIYVFGSGSTIDMMPIDFFDGKILIFVNYSYRIIKLPGYIIIHHHPILEEIPEKLHPVTFVSEYWTCRYDSPKINPGKYNIYNHKNQGYHVTDFTPLHENTNDTILTGGNTVINAIGLAVFMGAKNILLVGCDAGEINGQINCKGYYPEVTTAQHEQIQKGHAARSFALNLEIRTELKKIGVNLLSVFPFMDLACEGNRYDMNLDNEDLHYVKLVNEHRRKT